MIVEAPRSAVVIYQDGDEPWQLAPVVGDHVELEIAAERYAVVAVDPTRRRIDALYTTVEEHPIVRFAPAPLEVPTHTITGSVANVGELAGLAASPLESVPLGEGEMFALRVPEGSAPIVFGHSEASSGPQIDRLIVRRDISVLDDIAITVDLAEALPTSRFPLQVGNACTHRNVFSFGDTPVLLGSTKGMVITPQPAQWQSGDHLTIHLSCEGDASFRRVERDVGSVTVMPTQIEMPFQFGNLFLFVIDGRYRLSFDFFPAPTVGLTAFYELTQNDRCTAPCARWTTRVTEDWFGLELPEIDLLSPPDLAALGLLDPALEIPVTAPIEMMAITESEQARTRSGRRANMQVAE